jgi:hypothetical protein
MKTKYVIPVLSALVLTACGGDPVVEETENPLAELNEIMEDLNEDLTEIEGIQEIYSITSEAAGDFILGEKIPESTEDYSVEEKIETYESEEGPYEETVHIVSNGDEELLRITPQYDYETGEYLDEIGEMNISSDRFQTTEGIGAGSTLADFMEAYPDFKIWYTYISDMYVVETEGLSVQFLLDENGYVTDYPEIDSDMVEISKDDFDATTKIVSVRMFKL